MELHRLTASALAAAIRNGQTTSRAVVEAHLGRIDALGPAVNAVTVPLVESALAAADRADAGPPTGPLHGVPITVKENLDCVGSATTHGTRALRRAMPYADAPVVERMKAAGAIVIGRTNQSEMGLRVACDNPLRGRTRNPWRADRTAGGSSGGDAAAVATGMSPLGIGNDLGGSLRVPSALCGVAALKPTAGRVPHGASLPPHDYGLGGQLMLCHGPIARSVADLRLALSVLAGRDPRDPRSVTVPLVGPPVDRRAALVLDDALPAADIAAIERAGAALEAAGWVVEPATPPEMDRACAVWATLVEADFSATLPLMRPAISEALATYLERLLARLAEDAVPRVHVERSRLGRAWSGFFAEYPVVVGPAVPGGPWPLDDELTAGGIERLWAATRHVLPGNALGLPGVALPIDTHDGRPVAVQIQADLWREDLCLEAAEIVEAARGPIEPIDPVPWRAGA